MAGGFSAGILRIDLDDFPALAEPYGSVRLGTFPIGPDRRTDAWLKPILINRGEGDALHVLKAECTHEGCILPKMDSETRLIICREDGCGHGSQFAIDGSVRQGPANNALQTYEFQRDGSILTVQVPELFYDVTFRSSTVGNRVQIQFVAFYQMTYEVYFRQTLNGPAELASFSLTEDGPANLQEISGNFDSVYVTLYLDKPAALGLFQVAVKTSEV
jgi:nitrite reductase/ring-hydroxylating ferredoxin subunit